MRRLQNQVAGSVDERRLAAGKIAPQHKYQPAALQRQLADGLVGEILPANLLVAARLVVLDREHGIEQQHPLCRPAAQVAMRSRRDAQVLLQLLIYILQRRRNAAAARNRKTEPHSLPRIVVGILPQNDHFDLLKGRAVESIENEAARRINRAARFAGILQETYN